MGLNLVFAGRANLSAMERYAGRSDIVYAFYGHTSAMDAIVALLYAVRKSDIYKLIITSKHKHKIPSALHRFVHFVDLEKRSNSSKLLEETCECPLMFCVEGTRAYKDYIHSGFYHYAKRTRKKIAFVVFDLQKFRPIVSELHDPDEVSKDEILVRMRDFVASTFEYSTMYPEKCNKIRWRV